MRKAEAKKPVSRFQLSIRYERGLVIARDDRSIDSAFHLAAFDGQCNVLNNGLAPAGSFVHSTIGLAKKSVHHERSRPEPTHDEVSISRGRTIEVGLVRSSHVIACDEDTVGMRMGV